MLASVTSIRHSSCNDCRRGAWRFGARSRFFRPFDPFGRPRFGLSGASSGPAFGKNWPPAPRFGALSSAIGGAGVIVSSFMVESAFRRY